MGTYDTFEGGVQVKMGNCEMRYFKIGDVTPNDFPTDCIIACPEGIVVIKDSVFLGVLVHSLVYDKWGNELDIKHLVDKNHPIHGLCETFIKSYEETKKLVEVKENESDGAT